MKVTNYPMTCRDCLFQWVFVSATPPATDENCPFCGSTRSTADTKAKAA